MTPNPTTTPPSNGDGETLTQADEELLAAAREVLPRAVCTQSGFPVGAAVRTERGKVFAGVNVESASYGLTQCAERAAVAAAVAATGERKIEAVAVVTKTADPVAPCGACRQVLAEFGADMRVVMAGKEGKPWVTTMGVLLPHPFLLLPDEDPLS
ncbi:cytidine deaminase [Candidatus Woesearchaeota archaeon]|jgi:cytidine deaminase|nr:cytidine deaminase [Candidatus Woesearchaeota archaeon]MDP6738890.1 cytidine deaminase [Planctomycetota bacterium]MDP6939916.1 cytidine deaminase [Planctomycetota bacterium]